MCTVSPYLTGFKEYIFSVLLSELTEEDSSISRFCSFTNAHFCTTSCSCSLITWGCQFCDQHMLMEQQNGVSSIAIYTYTLNFKHRLEWYSVFKLKKAKCPLHTRFIKLFFSKKFLHWEGVRRNGGEVEQGRPGKKERGRETGREADKEKEWQKERERERLPPIPIPNSDPKEKNFYRIVIQQHCLSSKELQSYLTVISIQVYLNLGLPWNLSHPNEILLVLSVSEDWLVDIKYIIWYYWKFYSKLILYWKHGGKSCFREFTLFGLYKCDS